jgi:hypothetical protein
MYKTLFKTLAIAGTFGLSLSASDVRASDFKRVTTEEEFRTLVAGKKLYFNENYVTARKNGKVTGKFGGKTLKGAWAWRDGYFCRTLTTHSKDTDCQLWAVNGNQHKVTRKRGKGKQFVYTTR